MASAAESIHMRDQSEHGCLGTTSTATELIAFYQNGTLSPVEVFKQSLARIQDVDEILGAMLVNTSDLGMAQAKHAEQAWRQGSAGPLSGVPVSIKDTFDVAGFVTTRGSKLHQRQLALEDSGVIRRLKAAGAVFVGKTNTAEFGQSATNENMLGPVARNPWNIDMTPGGSSGGAAASVAAGYVPLALGADGGGSIRIPAAMTGLFGFKPTYGLCSDEGGFRAMSDFCCPGPLSQSVADARLFMSVLAEKPFPRRNSKKVLRVGCCLAPEGRPVHPGIRSAIASAATLLSDLGHIVTEVNPNFKGWAEAFGPLVLAEEWRERGYLLERCKEVFTDYEISSLIGGSKLTPDMVSHARALHQQYRERIASLFDQFDFLLTPTVALPAFEIGTRPTEIDGKPVGRLWGAFPFTALFNVAGTPAAAMPCGLVDGLPVSVQLVAPLGKDGDLLDLAENLEEAMDFRNQYLIPHIRLHLSHG